MSEPAVTTDPPVTDPPPAPAPVPADPATGVGIPNWATMRETLPQEIKDAPYMQNHESFEKFARDAVTQHRLVGFDKVARPKPLADGGTQEDWDIFYDSVGRPEKYDLGDFAPPEEIQWDQSMQDGYLEDAHSAGLSNAQTNAMLRSHAGRLQRQARDGNEAMQDARQETDRALREQWGNGYDRKKKMADDEFKRVFGDNSALVADINLPNGRAFGNEPAIIQSFFNLAEMHREHKLVGETEIAEPSLSPAEALKQAQAMEANPETAKIIAEDFKRKTAEGQRWDRLMSFAYPDQPR